MTDVQETVDNSSAVTPASASEKQQETRDEMLFRHRKEAAQLQNKENELKKAAAKGSKAEQKAKMRQVDEEISQLSAKAIAGVSVANQPEHAKISKGAKKRGKRAQQEAEREKRMQEEQSSCVSDQMIEDEKLETKLEPLGLTVNEIKPDGNCLYRAVEHQLALLSGGSSPHTYQELREMVAAYMRENASDFMPVFLSEKSSEECSDGSLADRFENHCKEIESAAAWGGQLELGALSRCLRRHIRIFSGSFPDVEMGKEYKRDGGTGSSAATIMLSYHKYAFGLGEHYNSVVPNFIRQVVLN